MITQISEITLSFFKEKNQYGDICANARWQEINGHFFIYLLLMSSLMRMDLLQWNGLWGLENGVRKCLLTYSPYYFPSNWNCASCIKHNFNAVPQSSRKTVLKLRA